MRILLFAVVSALASCSPISEEKAKIIANEKFKDFCARKGYEIKDFSEPYFLLNIHKRYVLSATWQYKEMKSFVMINVDNYGDGIFAYDNFPPED